MKQVTKQAADAIINEYVKPVFGFAMKRCKTMHDAEDLAQEILCRAYRALLMRDDVEDAERFLWAIAHNALSNYYRSAARLAIGVPMDAVGETADSQDVLADVEARETITRLQREIAYLSGMQRRIVIAYWFDGRRQSDIAKMLGIPEGTVKWHLFEAKKELKRGLDKMRQASELKFNPIHFAAIGVNGNTGAENPAEKLRSVIAQNICYCVRGSWKTIHQIADDLGVSPVYVEDEVARLEEYGLLRLRGDRYIANFIIDEPTSALLSMQDAMYRKAAALFANELCDALTRSGLLDDPAILRGKGADHNFLLWALVPYIAARSGDELRSRAISFDEATTIRPDGGQNIIQAAVVRDDSVYPANFLPMNNWCGPMWNGLDSHILWQVNSEWSSREQPNHLYPENSRRVLRLYASDQQEKLSPDEYGWLAEQGLVRMTRNESGAAHADWQIVVLKEAAIREKLLGVGKAIKLRHQAELDALKAPYAAASLAAAPEHLRNVRAYELQFIFHDDGWFLLHCIHALLESGKLVLPDEVQRKALTTLIVPA